ncbi:Uncharacterised protein [Mycobacteroides abscessus subsp. bolletii]|nr:Uncharacterised protein [Mycobacteroides abscessus subsp. bolletii]
MMGLVSWLVWLILFWGLVSWSMTGWAVVFAGWAVMVLLLSLGFRRLVYSVR